MLFTIMCILLFVAAGNIFVEYIARPSLLKHQLTAGAPPQNSDPRIQYVPSEQGHPQGQILMLRCSILMRCGGILCPVFVGCGIYGLYIVGSNWWLVGVPFIGLGVLQSYMTHFDKKHGLSIEKKL